MTEWSGEFGRVADVILLAEGNADLERLAAIEDAIAHVYVGSVSAAVATAAVPLVRAGRVTSQGVADFGRQVAIEVARLVAAHVAVEQELLERLARATGTSSAESLRDALDALTGGQS